MRYFAYGSNLLDAELTDKGITFNRVGRALLAGWRLEFRRRRENGTGAADIVKRGGDVVWGYIYDVPEGADGWGKLDKKEGVPIKAYRRLTVSVERDGQPEECCTYEVVDKADTELAPPEAYARKILRGAREKELPQDYIDQVKQRMQSLGVKLDS